MIEPRPISGFYENLPEAQIIEDNFKDIIKKNYALSGFVSVETPVVERVETLTSKGGDDNEIYGIHRLSGEKSDDVSLGLRFDLTVPLARYVSQYEGELNFPFKRQQIQKSYRGERPQKGRYREFYQADIDIIGNGKLPLFADVEVLSTIYNTLRELNFGDFVINLNNKKVLVGFLESLGVSDIVKTIGVIDKKDKIRNITPLFEEVGCTELQITSIFELIDYSKKSSNEEKLQYFSQFQNETLSEGIDELSYIYNNLLQLGVEKKSIVLNPSISRGLNYYTGTVYETFISGYEKVGSVSSGGRYENLCSNFTKNLFPGVGGSIGLSRLLFVLNEIGKIELGKKTPTEVLVVNMSEKVLAENLELVKYLRGNGVSTEIYLDSGAKMGKQFKYANNKKIPYVIIMGEDEVEQGIMQLKKLEGGEQIELTKDTLLQEINK